MRVLKSLVWLLLLATSARAQDSVSSIDELIPETDTSVMTVEKDTVAVFQADKKTGVTWNDRKVPDSTLQRLRRDEAFWYANADLKKKKPEVRDTSFWQWLFGQTWLYNLLWTLIVISFVGVVLLFLSKSNISLFQRSAKKIANASASGTIEDIFSIDYNSAIRDAVADGDFQSAVRFQYLHTLMLLAAKKLIRYKADATNSDYLAQLQQTPHYGPFKKLTRRYEYAWYGKFAIPPAAYRTIEQEFTTFKQDMGI